MKFKWVVLLVALICVACACSAAEPLSPPEQAYIDFLHACEDGDLSKAETFLTKQAMAALQEPTALTDDLCYRYTHNGYSLDQAYGYTFSYSTVRPDAVEYRDFDTDQAEAELGAEIGYDGVIEVAELTWILGEETETDRTTYVQTIKVWMYKINSDWKIEGTWLDGH